MAGGGFDQGITMSLSLVASASPIIGSLNHLKIGAADGLDTFRQAPLAALTRKRQHDVGQQVRVVADLKRLLRQRFGDDLDSRGGDGIHIIFDRQRLLAR